MHRASRGDPQARSLMGRAPKRSRRAGAYADGMSESATELPADDAPLARAADDARRGVATHLTINGVRVAVIMPEGVIEALRDFAAMLTDERIATYLPTLLPRAMPWTRSLPEADVPAFVAILPQPPLAATTLRRRLQQSSGNGR